MVLQEGKMEGVAVWSFHRRMEISPILNEIFVALLMLHSHAKASNATKTREVLFLAFNG